MDPSVSDEDGEAPARSRRGAVMIFLLGWLFVPILAIVLGELRRPWFEVGCVAMLAFIAVFIVVTVRAVRF